MARKVKAAGRKTREGKVRRVEAGGGGGKQRDGTTLRAAVVVKRHRRARSRGTPRRHTQHCFILVFLLIHFIHWETMAERFASWRGAEEATGSPPARLLKL